jgi:hypothetical protein
VIVCPFGTVMNTGSECSAMLIVFVPQGRYKLGVYEANYPQCPIYNDNMLCLIVAKVIFE